MAGQADQMLGFSWRDPIIMSSKKRKMTVVKSLLLFVTAKGGCI